MAAEDAAARAALRARQGEGARHDADSAPHADLLLARRGTAYFARKFNELADDDLGAASLRSGWSRRCLVAHVSYRARAIARALETARTGVEQPIHPSEEVRDAEIAPGATLPARALRHLFVHTAKHLDVEWRDLPDAGWDSCLRMPDGAVITARDTPRMRALEIWQAAVDLGNGARRADIPGALRD